MNSPPATPPIPDLAVFFIAAVLSLFVSVVVVSVGHFLGKQARFFGSASPRHLFVEITVLNLLALIPALLVSRSSVPHSDAPVGVAAYLVLLVVPLWAAARLRSRLRGDATPSLALGLIALGTSSLLAWTALLFTSMGLGAALLYSIKVLVAVVVAFVFLRSIIELIGFTASRAYTPTLAIRESARVYRFRHLLVWGFRLSFGLWLVASILYFSPRSSPDWFYLPAGFLEIAKVFGHVPPPERTLGNILANSLPPIAVLLMGASVARRATDVVSFLFSLLCLLYGLWGLDVFPVWGGGPVLWSLHLLAWLFVAPVQLHFALTFPRREEQLHESSLPTWRATLRQLYGAYALLASPFLLLNLKMERYTNLLPRKEDTAILFSPFLRFVVAGVGMVSVPLAWLIGAYVLLLTWRRLGREYDRIHSRVSSGCLWQDLMEGRILNRNRPSWAFGAPQIRQLQWVGVGAGIACLVFLVWYALLVPLTAHAENPIGDALGKMAVALFFACATFAMLRYQLFETRRDTTQAAIGTLVTLVAVVVSMVIADALQAWAAVYVGLLALLLGRVGIDKLIEVALYRRLWPMKSDWHRRLADESAALPNLPVAIQSVINVLERVSPPDATACWLLRAGKEPESGAHEIRHSHSGANCRPALLERLGMGVTTGTQRELPPDLRSCLAEAATRGEQGRILQAASLLDPWRPGKMPVVFGLGPHLHKLAIRLLNWGSECGRNGLAVGEETWRQLLSARIVLLIPLGGASLYGVYLVGTDGYGDHYDRHDLAALNNFHHTLSARLGPAVPVVSVPVSPRLPGATA